MGLMDGLKRAATEAAAEAQPQPQPEEKPQRSLQDRTMYAGFTMNNLGEATGLATSGVHQLVLAGTGSGKSRRIAVPQLATWDGPACAVSAKSDLAEMSAAIRSRTGGDVYVMDLTGQADWEKLPDSVIRVTSDPCALLIPDENGSTDDAALDLANLLLQVGVLSQKGGGGGGDAAFWATLSVGVLACLLQAGSWYPDPDTEEDVWGGGIDWVRKAALNPGDETEADEDEELDLLTPSWDTAQLRATLVDSDHAGEITATKMLDPRQRDSVGINLRVALSSWSKRAVRESDEGGVAFTPELLTDPAATLYIVSPMSGAAAGAAVATVESLVEHWTLNAVKDGLPKIAMVIDECTQTAPLVGESVMSHISLMRGYGMHFMLIAQHSDQFKARYGEALARAILSIFPSVLIGTGAIEKDIIELAAWTTPPSERRTESHDASGRGSLSADRIETFHPSELLPRHQGEGRLIVRGMPSHKVKLLDYTNM